MSAPRVSFILPIYNGGRYLRETLESLFAQTFSDFEIVAVNDGSTDETAEILREVHDPRVRVIARENRGLVASLNEAIGAARGELLARIDADDICMPWRLERQVGFLDAHADISVAGSAIETFGGERVETIVYPDRPAATMLFRSAMAHPSVMIRKSMLEKHGLQYREPYRCAQDYDLWCRCIVRGVGIRNMPEPLIRYRMHAGQITQALAEPTQVEGEAIRAEFVRTMLPEASGADLTLHNAIARNQFVATEEFVSRASAWLAQLGSSPVLARFIDREMLLPVLTGRYVSICRFAASKGLPVRAAELFAPFIRPGAMD